MKIMGIFCVISFTVWMVLVSFAAFSSVSLIHDLRARVAVLESILEAEGSLDD